MIPFLMSYYPRVAAAIWFFLLGSLCPGLAQSPAPPTAQPDNPALKAFGRSITFYASFDGSLRADLANGKPDPTQVEGAPLFLPGLYGKAMMLTDANKPGANVIADYPLLNNVDLTKPGSLAVWLSPRKWVRGDEEPYFWPVKIMGNNGVQLMFGRQGQLLNPTRRTDMVYLWVKIGESKDFSVGGGSSLHWKNDEWHLWVMNWRSSSVEFSMDGAALQRQDTPAKVDAAGAQGGHLFLDLGVVGCPYLLDELLVLNRPLDAEEIKWLYEQGMKALPVHPSSGSKSIPDNPKPPEAGTANK